MAGLPDKTHHSLVLTPILSTKIGNNGESCWLYQLLGNVIQEKRLQMRLQTQCARLVFKIGTEPWSTLLTLVSRLTILTVFRLQNRVLHA